MRWVFISMLVVNAAYFVWQVFSPDRDSVQPAGGNLQEVETIYLLDEARDLAQPRQSENQSTLGISVAPEGASGQGEEAPKSQEGVLCDAFGPFFDRQQGVTLVDFLRTQDVNGDIVAETLRTTTRYWLFVEPLASVNDAIELRIKLSQSGIESYLISEGPEKHGLSIGLYRNEANAQGMVQLLRQHAVEAKIEEKRSDIEEYWVLLREQKLATLDSKKSQQIREFTDQNRAVQKVCKAIASLQ